MTRKGKTTAARAAKGARRKKAGPLFDFVVHDDDMAPTICKNDHVTIDTRIKSFDEFCQGVYLVQIGPPGHWQLVRPVPWVKDGRIEAIVGIRQENVAGFRLKDPARIKVLGRALVVHRHIAPVYHQA